MHLLRIKSTAAKSATAADSSASDSTYRRFDNANSTARHPTQPWTGHTHNLAK